jgi:hypothetical protein
VAVSIFKTKTVCTVEWAPHQGKWCCIVRTGKINEANGYGDTPREAYDQCMAELAWWRRQRAAGVNGPGQWPIYTGHITEDQIKAAGEEAQKNMYGGNFPIRRVGL